MPEDGLAQISGWVHVKNKETLQRLQSEHGYLMIESVEKSNGDQFYPANLATGRSIHSSRASLLPVMASPDASRTGWAKARAL